MSAFPLGFLPVFPPFMLQREITAVHVRTGQCSVPELQSQLAAQLKISPPFIKQAF